MSNFERILADSDTVGCDRECCVTPIVKGVTRMNLDPKTGKAYCLTSGGTCTGFTVKELTEIGRAAVIAHRDGQVLPATITALATKTVPTAVDPMVMLQDLAKNLPDGATVKDLIAALGKPAAPVATHTPGPVVSSGRRSPKVTK